LTAKLDKPLQRELMISGHPYVVTLSPAGIKLVLKGSREKGCELDWQSLVNGDAALAAALNATDATPTTASAALEPITPLRRSGFSFRSRPTLRAHSARDLPP
jgi:hypothetical protein